MKSQNRSARTHHAQKAGKPRPAAATATAAKLQTQPDESRPKTASPNLVATDRTRRKQQARIIAMLRAPSGTTIEAMCTQRDGNSIRSAASLPASCAKSLASNLSVGGDADGPYIGSRIASAPAGEPPRNAMRRGTARSASPDRSLEDEIAHLRDLDLNGLRARWKGIFRRQPPAHISPASAVCSACLSAFKPMSLGISTPLRHGC